MKYQLNSAKKCKHWTRFQVQEFLPNKTQRSIILSCNLSIQNCKQTKLFNIRASEERVLTTFRLVQTVPKLNLGRYEFQKKGRIGSTEMYLIWERFGPTEKLSGLILHWL